LKTKLRKKNPKNRKFSTRITYTQPFGRAAFGNFELRYIRKNGKRRRT